MYLEGCRTETSEGDTALLFIDVPSAIRSGINRIDAG